ncbi:MAG: nucleotidyltransferase domain-containing protein [Bryobacteraceae bacterium]
MSTEMSPDSPDLNEVRRLVLRGLSGRRARVYLFGSWARGDASRVSDIDVAVLPLEPLPPVRWLRSRRLWR